MLSLEANYRKWGESETRNEPDREAISEGNFSGRDALLNHQADHAKSLGHIETDWNLDLFQNTNEEKKKS